MKQFSPVFFLLISCIVFTKVNAQNDSSSVNWKSDSTKHVTRAYNKITFQMKRFNEAVTGYVKTLKKAEPADSNITGDVEAYSDSLNKALEASDKNDTVSVKRVKAAFDSLLQATVRLVKKVENDSNLRNNKTLRQLNGMMNSLKESIDKYQAELTTQFRKKDDAELKEEPEPMEEPAPAEEPEPEPPAKKKTEKKK